MIKVNRAAEKITAAFTAVAEWAVGTQAALHLEETEARLVVSRGGRTLRWGEVKLPATIFQDGMVVDSAGLASHLAPLFSSLRASRKQVLLSLDGLNAMVRTVTLPKIESSFIPEAIRRELRREVAVPLEDHYIVSQVLRTNQERMEVLVLAIHQPELDSVLTALRKAKIYPVMLDWKPLAVARAVNQADAAIVTMDVTSIHITITQDGVPAMVRTIPCSQPGSITQQIDQVATELSLTLSYAAGANSAKEEPIVYLLGSGAGDPAVRERLQDAIGHQVEELPVIEDDSKFPMWEYAANVGLVFRRRDRRAPLFRKAKQPDRMLTLPDLLPDSWRVRTIPFRQGVWAMMMAVSLGAVVPSLVSSFQPDPQLEALRQDTARVEREITALQQQVRLEQGDLREGELVVQELQEWQEGMTSLQASDQHWPDLAQTVPRELILGAVTEDSQGLTLSGRAPSYLDVVVYANSLGSTGLFKEVTLHSLVSDQTEPGMAGTSFNLVAEKHDTNLIGDE